ncbi:MAG: thioredoxin family protein, partial [Proteobacteria bacterium]|nr:thioredoxin family protein [Pseudomonadota bacterium]
QLYEATKEAIEQSGLDVDLAKIQKIEEISEYGIAFTPALVIDGQVVSSGKVPKVDKIVSWLQKAQK